MGVGSRNTESDATFLRKTLSGGQQQPAIEAAPRRGRERHPKPQKAPSQSRRNPRVQQTLYVENPPVTTVYAAAEGGGRERRVKHHYILKTMAGLLTAAVCGGIVYGATRIYHSADGLHYESDDNDQEAIDALPTTVPVTQAVATTVAAAPATTVAAAQPVTTTAAPAATTPQTTVAAANAVAPSNGEVPLAGTPIPLEIGQGGVSAIVDFCFGGIVIDYSNLANLSPPWNQIIAHNESGVFNSDINNASIQGSDWQRPQLPVC